MGSCTSLPSAKRTQKQTLSDNYVDCAIYATQGRRPRMEDDFVARLSLPRNPQYSLFGVFDGFNGADASAYLSQNIVNVLDTIPNLEDNDAIVHAIEKLDTQYIHCENTSADRAAGTTFTFALIHTIAKDVSRAITFVDNHSTSHNDSNEAGFASEYKSLNHSLTADDVVSFAVGDAYHVRVFWAGDSRAVLMSDSFKKVSNLTQDHYCDLPEEAKRINNAEGEIINGRIEGICEVTRCFGCYPMKDNAFLSRNKQKMISTPECTTLSCKKNDRLFLFCDGVIKKWTDNQFNALCKHHVQQHEDEEKGNLYALEYLSEQAIDEGSPDNVTILSIQFK